MAAFGESLRGNGLSRAQRALAALEQDPQQLDRERARFSDSPPPYTSHQSHNSTRSQSPDPLNEEQRSDEDRRWQLKREREASLPRNQFDAQTSQEIKNILADHQNLIRSIPPGVNFHQLANENVKKRWIEQGIWNEIWNERRLFYGRWKHEEPLEPELESDAEEEPQRFVFSFAPQKPPTPKLPKSDEEKRRIAERQATRAREREASRPFPQFVYQISQERERIQARPVAEGVSTVPAAYDINTTAYENVKRTWTERKIWNTSWGILPGMSWKHEKPPEEGTANGSASVHANPLANDRHETREVLPLIEDGPRLISPRTGRVVLDFTIPGQPLFAPSPPVESEHHQVSDTMNASQDQPPADTASHGLENGHAESPEPPEGQGAQLFGTSTSPPAQPNRRKPPHTGRKPPATTSSTLGPAHPSRVSKAPKKKKAGPRRPPNTSEAGPSGNPPLSSRPETAEPQLQAASPPRRRSKRLQVAEDISAMTPPDSPKPAVQPRSKRTVAGTQKPASKSAAKPQGVVKKRGGGRGRKTAG